MWHTGKSAHRQFISNDCVTGCNFSYQHPKETHKDANITSIIYVCPFDCYISQSLFCMSTVLIIPHSVKNYTKAFRIHRRKVNLTTVWCKSPAVANSYAVTFKSYLISKSKAVTASLVISVENSSQRNQNEVSETTTATVFIKYGLTFFSRRCLIAI